MRWFSWGRSGKDAEKDDYMDIDYRKRLLVQSRGMGYIDSSDLSDLESPFGAPSSPFSQILQSNDDNVCEEILCVDSVSDTTIIINRCPGISFVMGLVSKISSTHIQRMSFPC